MTKKIVIIGGGVAGLSAGIYGQMNGYETEIVEMNSIAGGHCTAWNRNGYHFDLCLHWLVGSSKGEYNDIWKEINVINDQTKIIEFEVFQRLANEKGDELLIYSNLNRWKKYLIERAPEDKTGIKKMIRDIRKAKIILKVKIRYKFFNMLISKFQKLLMLPLFLKYGRITCKEYFEKLDFKNPQLCYFLKNYFGESWSALFFMLTIGCFDQKNAGYIIGGSLPMAKRMVERYLSLGGKLTLNKKVSKIIVEKDISTGVILSDGSIIKADYVISAADGRTTIFEMLDGKYLSDHIRSVYEKRKLFTSLVHVSFGINAEIKSEYQYQFFLEGKKIGSTKLNRGYSMINYSFDPTLAPNGKTVIVIRFESPWEIWKDMKGDVYKAEKEKIKIESIAILESHFPGISSKIEVVDIATPLTDIRYTGVWKGAYQGFLAPHIYHIDYTLPNLKNFYMTGQWVVPGGGLPPSVHTSKVVITKICKKDKKAFKII